ADQDRAYVGEAKTAALDVLLGGRAGLRRDHGEITSCRGGRGEADREQSGLDPTTAVLGKCGGAAELGDTLGGDPQSADPGWDAVSASEVTMESSGACHVRHGPLEIVTGEGLV